jgi:hypothetical protein
LIITAGGKSHGAQKNSFIASKYTDLAGKIRAKLN